MTPVGKKDGPPVAAFLAFELREGFGFSAAGGGAVKGGSIARREDDHAVAVPGAAAADRSLADRLGHPARGIDLLQFPIGEEADEPAVRRPEGKRRALGVRKDSRGERADG